MTVTDRKYGPQRKVVAVLTHYQSRGRYGTATRASRERVRLSCGHERAWYAGRTHARCTDCRPGKRRALRKPMRPAFKAPLHPAQVLSPEQALSQYEKLINKLSWRTAQRLPPTSTFSQPDLFQEGVVVTLRSLAKYKPARAAFITYLYVSLNNRYGQILKREWADATALPRATLSLRGRVPGEDELPLDLAVLPEQDGVALALDLRRAALDLDRNPSWEGAIA